MPCGRAPRPAGPVLRRRSSGRSGPARGSGGRRPAVLGGHAVQRLRRGGLALTPCPARRASGREACRPAAEPGAAGASRHDGGAMAPSPRLTSKTASIRVTASGGIWRHLAASGGIWRHLAASGGIWRHRAASGGIWWPPAAQAGWRGLNEASLSRPIGAVLPDQNGERQAGLAACGSRPSRASTLRNWIPSPASRTRPPHHAIMPAR